MKKIKTINILYIFLVLGLLVFSFYLYIGYSFGNGVSKMGKDLYEVKKEWKKNGQNPMDSIENNVINVMDSVSNEHHKDSLIH